jgi:hypothetical protein
MKERRAVLMQLWLMCEASGQMPQEWYALSSLSSEGLLAITAACEERLVVGQPKTLRDIMRSMRKLV